MCVETFTLKYDNLNVPRNALLMAMGYSQKAFLPVNEVVDEVLSNGGVLCEIQGGYKILNSSVFKENKFGILVDKLLLNVQKVAFHQIKRSTNVAVFVCTVGQKIIDRSKELMKDGDLLCGYVYDVFGSIVVEAAMEIIPSNLQKEISPAGLKITNRYSSGYCGWNVAEQRNLFGLLPEHFCDIELVRFNQYTCNMCDGEIASIKI